MPKTFPRIPGKILLVLRLGAPNRFQLRAFAARVSLKCGTAHYWYRSAPKGGSILVFSQSISCILEAMVFFDATGKRWKKIKLSAAGMAMLAATPIFLLGIGTLAYQPKWSRLPLVSQAQDLVSQAASIATGQVAIVSHPSASPTPSPSTIAKPSRPVAKTASASATHTSAPAPSPAVLSAQTHTTPHATPVPTTTPTQVPNSAPGNSGNHSKGTPSPKH